MTEEKQETQTDWLAVQSESKHLGALSELKIRVEQLQSPTKKDVVAVAAPQLSRDTAQVVNADF